MPHLSILKALAATIAIVGVACSSPFAQEVEPTLKITTKGNVTDVRAIGEGTYTDVIEDVLRLRQQGSEADAAVLARIERDRDSLPPPYYLEAARRTCQSDPAAAFDWLALYSIRARYDARRCTDESARDNVSGTLMALQIPECRATMQDRPLQLERLEATFARDDLFSGTASPWWICSGGLSVIISLLDEEIGNTPPGAAEHAEGWLKPTDTWEAIQAEILAEAEASLKKHKATP